MSRISTAGRARPAMRPGRRNRVSAPRSAAWAASSEGVAEPSTSAAPAARARTQATCRAWVPRRLILFIGGVVFFVEDDQSEIGDGGQHRGAGAEHDARFAAADPPERGAALGGAEPAVEHGDSRAEPGAEEGFVLRGERDLGNEEQGAPAGFESRGDRLEIDLGLPAPGNPVEQEGAEGAGPERLPEDLGRCLLGSGERRRLGELGDGSARWSRRRGRRFGVGRFGGKTLGGDRDQPLPLETREAPPRGKVELAADAHQRDRTLGDGEQREDAPVVVIQPHEPFGARIVGLPEARGAFRGDPGGLELPAGGRRRRQHGPQDEAERADREFGDAAREGEEIFRERRERVVVPRADGLDDHLFLRSRG